MRAKPNDRPMPALTGLLVILALLGAGCGSDGAAPTTASPLVGVPTPPTPPAGAEPSTSANAADEVEYRGVFLPWAAGANAVTYEPAVVPPGSTALLTTVPATGGVTVALSVTGMIPHRAYGAHLHTAPCTGTPAQAGPHYQHRADPKAVASPPSVDPEFANPRNEVWLDFTADDIGSATVTATQAWPFDAVNPPRSLIVHAQPTKTAAGEAGTAGPRVACLTLPV